MSHTPHLSPARTTLHPDPAPSPPPPARRRDPWFDNAKMLLVTLVVVGHAWTLLPDDRVAGGLFDFLYAWHVPAFVMVTGYLSRSFTWTRRDLSRLLRTVAVPYLVFEAVIAGFRFLVGGERLDLLFVDPHWPMWYLAALFLWRLATPLLRSPGGLAAAVAVSLLGGLSTSEVLDTSRATGLLPFFVLGLLARPEHVALLRRRPARVAGAAALAGWLVAALLVLYLFHGFAVLGAEYAGFPGWAATHPTAGLVLSTAASVALALALAAPPVARRLQVLVDPVGGRRRRSAAPVD